MPVRFLTRAALMVAFLLANLEAVQAPAHANPAAMALSTLPVAVTSPESRADSLNQSPSDVIAAARSAHQTAWAQRQAGDFEAALDVSQKALFDVEGVLQGDVAAAERRELLDLRSKLMGQRDIARHELEQAKTKPAPGPGRAASPASDAVDDQVLNAPAVEQIEPQLNADVVHYIEFFTGAGRSTFERWLRRSGRYMSLFKSVLQREGLPPDLAHLVFVESGFNLDARSVSAAVGPWQFLRSTGRLFGLTVNQWVDERKDPEKSTVAAARYLRHLYSIYGDWPLALASYNAGEGTVLRAIKRQGTTNYWDLHLPRQTEDYVPQFMAVLAISRDPQKYGFDSVELEDPMEFDEMALKGAVDLRQIATLADCSYEEMKRLNPSVLRHAAPGRDGVTVLRVPRGKAEAVLSRLEGGVSMPAVDLTVKHRVRRGETLVGIAKQYHVDATRLARDNGVGRKRPLRRGMVLTVRASMKQGPLEAVKMDPDNPTVSTDYVPQRKIGVPASIRAESNAKGRISHTVRRGETLGAIAAKYDVSVSDIKRWNRLTQGTVRRGTRLKIRTGDAAVASAESVAADSATVATLKPPAGKHSGRRVAARSVVKVRPGETLGQIASRHGVSLTRLKRANGLTSNRVIAGQRLRIPA